jgi:hypothetical protein
VLFGLLPAASLDGRIRYERMMLRLICIPEMMESSILLIVALLSLSDCLCAWNR